MRAPKVPPPAALRNIPGWLLWKRERGPRAKVLKVPYWANGAKRQGQQGSEEDRKRLVTYDVAVAALQRGGYDGLGFACLPGFGVTVLDFDACVQGDDVNPEVLNLIGDTYAERSPSGAGVHAIYWGDDLPNKKSHADHTRWGFEVFSTTGFTTFTGDVLPGWDLTGLDATIAQINDGVRALYRQRFGRDRLERSSSAANAGVDPSAERTGIDADEARELLDRIDPDIGYEDWLRVGMGLHHEFGDEGLALWDDWSCRGSKYPGVGGLEPHWRSFGHHGGPQITMRTVHKLAGGGQPASPEDFEALEHTLRSQAAPDDDSDLKFPAQTIGQFTKGKKLSWIVKGVIPQAQVGVVYGAPGSGKTFAVLDMTLAIARGQPRWNDKHVKPGPVVYLCAEGAFGLSERLVAYGNHFGVDTDALPFRVIDASPNLLDVPDVKHVVKSVKRVEARLGAPVRVIVVDTLAQVTPGANENAAEDMGRALAHCKRLHEATGAMVLLIHHSGKDASKGARGWSGLRGACDVEIEVARSEADKHLRCMRVTKLKDGPDGGEFWFRLVDVALGLDEDLEPTGSCVVEAASPPAVGALAARELGPVERVVNDVVQECAQAQLDGIEVGYVIKEAVQRMAAPEEGKRDTRRQRAKRALEALCTGDDAPYRLNEDGKTLEVF